MCVCNYICICIYIYVYPCMYIYICMSYACQCMNCVCIWEILKIRVHFGTFPQREKTSASPRACTRPRPKGQSANPT